MEIHNFVLCVVFIEICLFALTLVNFKGINKIFDILIRLMEIYDKETDNIYDCISSVNDELDRLEKENKILKEKVDLLETIVYNKFVRNRG